MYGCLKVSVLPLRAFVSLTMLAAATVQAVTPCDFKGLSVGDKATPAQIMKHFGIVKFVADSDAEFTKQSTAPRQPTLVPGGAGPEEIIRRSARTAEISQSFRALKLEPFLEP
jgi:hypothetical protein